MSTYFKLVWLFCFVFSANIILNNLSLLSSLKFNLNSKGINYLMFCLNYNGHFERNTSFFIMLAHDVRGECWWYGSKRTFLPINIFVLLQITTKWQSGKMVYVMKWDMKQWYFIYWHLLERPNIVGHWVMHFDIGTSWMDIVRKRTATYAHKPYSR